MHARTETTSAPRPTSKFVSLKENRSARIAVRRLAAYVRSSRRVPFDLLFICGPTGTGKTSLVRWLQRVCQSHSIGVISAEEFVAATNELGSADLLIVEDVHHLPARAAAAFESLLDRRRVRRRPTVATSNCGPAQLPLSGRIVSRLASGLIVELKPPRAASRRRLIEQFAAQRRLMIADEALDWLARQPIASVRQLQALVGRLATLSAGSPYRLELANVQQQCDLHSPLVDVTTIIERVARYYDVSAAEICGPDRHPQVTRARHTAMYLARNLTGQSLARIGAQFGKRDASTVRHACEKMALALNDDEKLVAEVRELEAAELMEKPSIVRH